MKGIIVCALVLVGAFVVKGAHEVCALNNDQITALVKCLGEKVDSKITGRAKEIIHSQGGDVAQLLKKQCGADVDFGAALKAILSPDQAEAVRKAYKECRPLQG